MGRSLTNQAASVQPLLKLPFATLRKICDHMPAMVAVYNVHSGQYIYVNHAVKNLLGYTPHEFISGGLPFVASLVHPTDLPKIMLKNQRALERVNKRALRAGEYEPIINFEYRMRHKNGSYVWLHSNGGVLDRKNGLVDHVLNISIDITSRKEALQKLRRAKAKQEVEAQLRAGEERYQAFISNSREGIWRVELDKPIDISLPHETQIKLMYKHGFLAESNVAMARMYGLKSVDEINGARLGDLLVESDPKNTTYLNTFIKSGYNLTNTVSHEVDFEGKDKYFSNSLVGIVENGLLLRAWGTQLDVTEKHKSDETLKASQERLALALKASKLGLWEWDVRTNELHWSDEQKKIFGMKKSDPITYAGYIKKLHPDSLTLMEKTIEQSQKSGKDYQVELKIIWPDGTAHWILGQGQAILENGKPIRIVGTSINIDEHKKSAELEMNNQRLLAERELLLELNTAKDEFISIASHQLRTPATGVKQYLGMLLQGHGGKLEVSKDQLKMLRVAYDSNERQIQIINDLLKTAQVDSGKLNLKKRRTDIVRLVKNVIDDLQPSFKSKQQTIELHNNQDKVFVMVDGDKVHMAIENVLDNASKYSFEKTHIAISLKTSSNNVAVKITDQGVGISKQNQDKLFQKFSRIDNPLSDKADGNGLGLYWVKKIVNQHGGKMRVKSAEGKGSTFTIELPLH